MNQFKFNKERLRASGLRPTKQRLVICQILFDRKETLYNTVHAFKNKGYLKEISLKGNKTFFDTNTKNHYHFFDEESSRLIDIKNQNISVNNLPKAPYGKKIKEIEITVRVASNTQKQKKNNQLK